MVFRNLPKTSLLEPEKIHYVYAMRPNIFYIFTFPIN